jgi:hypothetical protein
MMYLKRLDRLVRYFHDDWSFVVFDFDIKDAFGRIREDIDDMNFGWDVCVGFAKTTLSE